MPTRSRMPIKPWPTPGSAGGPRPSSTTSIVRRSGAYSSSTLALAGPACLSAFVSDSWITRYAARSAPAGQLAGGSRADHLDRQSRRAHGVEQRIELREPGHRCGRSGLAVVGQHADQAPHLRQSGTTGLLDLGDRVVRGLRIAVDDGPGRPRLDDHHAHRVGDHVVELARDAGPFEGDRLTSRGLSVQYQTAAAVEDDPTDQDGKAHREREPDHHLDPVVVLLRGELRCERTDDRERDAERRDPSPGLVRGDGVGRERQRRVARPSVTDERKGDGRPAHDPEDRQGRPSPHCERRARDQDERPRDGPVDAILRGHGGPDDRRDEGGEDRVPHERVHPPQALPPGPIHRKDASQPKACAPSSRGMSSSIRR